MRDMFKHSTEMTYLKELATVRMATSRSAGHSTAVAKIAAEYFHNPLFLSPNINMSYLLQEKVADALEKGSIVQATRTYIKTNDGHLRFSTVKGLEQCEAKFKAIQIDAVIVDGTFNLSRREEAMIYEKLLCHMITEKYKFFIFVQ